MEMPDFIVCSCVDCSECNGRGSVLVSPYNYDTCPFCGGSGLEKYCDECSIADSMERI